MQRWIGLGLVVGVLWLAPAGAAAQDDTADPKRVVASVNGVDLTYDDFKQRVDILEQERGPVAPERYPEILRALVREEILMQAATAAKLDQNAEVQKRIVVAQRQVLIETYLRQRVNASTQVTDAEVRKAYEDNKAQFTQESVKASHIMTKTRAEADQVEADLKAGQSFEELAKTRSQDAGSASKGGDLGELTRGQASPEFEQVLFQLKEGEVSEVVQTEFGFHVIKAGPHTTTVQPYDEVKDKLKEMVVKQKQREALLAVMAELDAKAKTEVHDDRLK
ncbi:MAG TPA: peptidylprolyl isomerase [Candidatus Baltobacteraceae bacterium]|nr:peptidylprolyl isomerase [Candidatus Baltobacteraceae bacterium]